MNTYKPAVSIAWDLAVHEAAHLHSKTIEQCSEEASKVFCYLNVDETSLINAVSNILPLARVFKDPNNARVIGVKSLVTSN